jgi:diphosphomevalonate decarboxylase
VQGRSRCDRSPDRTAHKQAGSTQGHQIAGTSPLQAARVGDAPRRLQICRQAILDKDFFTLADIAEQDSNMMHAVMLTSTPRLLYWLPATIEIMHAVETWRKEGLRVFYTIDAGPNVHCVCMPEDSLEVENRLRRLSSVQLVFRAGPGTGTVLK